MAGSVVRGFPRYGPISSCHNTKRENPFVRRRHTYRFPVTSQRCNLSYAGPGCKKLFWTPSIRIYTSTKKKFYFRLLNFSFWCEYYINIHIFGAPHIIRDLRWVATHFWPPPPVSCGAVTNRVTRLTRAIPDRTDQLYTVWPMPRTGSAGEKYWYTCANNRWRPSLLISVAVAKRFKIAKRAGGQFKYELIIYYKY